MFLFIIGIIPGVIYAIIETFVEQSLLMKAVLFAPMFICFSLLVLGNAYIYQRKFWKKEVRKIPLKEVGAGKYYLEIANGNVVFNCIDESTGQEVALEFEKEIVKFQEGEEPHLLADLEWPIYPWWWKFVRITDLDVKKNEIVVVCPKRG